MLTLKQFQLKTKKTKIGSDSGYWVFPLLSHLIPSLTVKDYFSWQAALSAIWACAIFFVLTAFLHVLKTASCRQNSLGLLQGCAERGLYGSDVKNRHLFIRTLLFVHMLRWHSPPLWIMYHSEKKRNSFSLGTPLLGGTGKLFQLYSWAALEELQNIKSLGWALLRAQTTELWAEAESCCTSPQHEEPF